MSTIWGTSAAFVNGLTGLEEWQRVDNLVKGLNGGFGHQARRSYNDGMPTTINGTYAAQDVGHRVSVFSVRAPVGDTGWNKTINGDYDANIRSFVRSVPSGHQMYLIYNHEPENDGGHPATLWRQAFARFAKVILDEGNSNITPTFNLMAYTWNDSSGRNPYDYNPGRHLTAAETAACVGMLDGYGDDTPVSRNPSAVFSEAYTQITGEWGFRGFGVAEMGVFNVAGRGNWMLALEDWATARDKVECLCWWHAADPGASYFLDAPINNDPTSFQVWADIIGRNQGADIPVSDPVDDVDLPPKPPPVVGSGNSSGYSRNGAPGLSTGHVLPSYDESKSWVCNGRVYWSGPSSTQLSDLWSAAITYDTTGDDFDQVWFHRYDPAGDEHATTPQPGGRPELTDFVQIPTPDAGEMSGSPFYFTMYQTTWDEADGVLWVFQTLNGDPSPGGTNYSLLTMAINTANGHLIASRHDEYIVGSVSSTTVEDRRDSTGWGLSDTRALLYHANDAGIGNDPRFVATWRIFEIDGTNITDSGPLSVTNPPDYHSFATTKRFNRDTGFGITQGVGDFIFSFNGEYFTWKLDEFDEITAYEVRAIYDDVSEQIGDGIVWVPDYYLYGNTHLMNNGHFVDIAYRFTQGDADPYPWNVILEYSIDESGLTVVQWEYLPQNAHAPSAALHLQNHVIGWGEGSNDSQGIVFTEDAGVLQVFFDFGYAFITPDGDGEFGHHIITDPFGTMDVDTVTNIGSDVYSIWPIITLPRTDDYWVDFPWTGGWFLGEGWLINFGNFFASANPTGTDDYWDYTSDLPGYDDYDTSPYSSVIFAVTGREIPNLGGELVEQRRKFARSPTDSTP